MSTKAKKKAPTATPRRPAAAGKCRLQRVDILRWWRYRGRYAEGPGKWDYVKAENETWAHETAMDEHADVVGMDGWRGVAVEQVEAPPIEWLRERIKTLEARRRGIVAEIKAMKLDAQYARMSDAPLHPSDSPSGCKAHSTPSAGSEPQ
jgi:hypothetical protein